MKGAAWKRRNLADRDGPVLKLLASMKGAAGKRRNSATVDPVVPVVMPQ